MDLQKILISRKTIIDIYKNYGYDTSSIPNLSIKELKIMLNEYKPLDTNISTFVDILLVMILGIMGATSMYIYVIYKYRLIWVQKFQYSPLIIFKA